MQVSCPETMLAEDSCITPTEVVTLAKEFEWIIPEPVPYDLVEW